MKITSRLILAEDKAKKGFQKVTLKLMLPSGEAKNNSVLGPLLGQHQINIMSFCNEFNSKSQILYQVGVPIPTFVYLKKDKTYVMDLRFPTLSFFLDQINKGLGKNREYLINEFYDVIKFLSFFLKKDVKSISYLVFGYLSSSNDKKNILFKKKI